MPAKFSPVKTFQSHSHTFLSRSISWSISVAMTLGVLVSVPKQVAGQAQPALSTQQSEQLQEAERLNQQVGQFYQQGKYNEAIPLAEKALAIREYYVPN